MHLPRLIDYIKKKPSKGNVIIGIGTGRCGTTALASLLNSQNNIVCFHEMNPSSMSWEGAEATVTSTLRDFDAILRGEEFGVTIDLTSPNRASPLKAAREKEEITAVGDVASYYLPYVKHILDRQPKAKFPCMTRRKEEVVRSFAGKLFNKADGTSRNHWAMRPSSKWIPDAKWDRCFPSYDLNESACLEDYISVYFDDYNGAVRRLMDEFPANIKMFDVQHLNTNQGCMEILDFCIGGGKVSSPIGVHNKGSR